jgi:hypothetical protein
MLPDQPSIVEALERLVPVETEWDKPMTPIYPIFTLER